MTTRILDSTSDGVLVASRTDVGQVRAANEDSCEIAYRADGARLLLVADGMGGHRGGATASQAAATLIGETFRANPQTAVLDLLSSAIEAANTEIYDQSRADPELEGMGTTVIAFVLDADLGGFVAHVGDSRAYRDREGRLEQITSDHSVVAEMQKRGLLTPEEAAQHPRRNEILRSVGVLPEVEVDSATVDVAAGDQFLLCSDGLTGLVADDEIAEILHAQSPSEAVESLIDLANDRGGLDNITVQILSVPADAKAARGPTPRTLDEAQTESAHAASPTLTEHASDPDASKRRTIALTGLLLALFGVAYYFLAR